MISEKLCIDDIQDKIKDKRILIRVDFNVPIKDGIITDNSRIVSSIPTIKYALDSGARCVILISHLGRPNNEKNKKYSLEICKPTLENILNKKVIFMEDCIGSEVQKICENAQNGEIILLENLRFHIEEEGSYILDDGSKQKANPEQIKEFRENLSKLGEIYVNDAFGTSHRAHSSITGINLQLKVAGFLMKKELKSFGKALENPERPFCVVMGGAKVKDKIQLIFNLLDK